MEKSIFASKTFWFNVITLAISLGQGQLGIQLPADVSAAIIAVGNVLLRIVSSQPVRVL